MDSMHIIASQTLGGAESFYARVVHALHEEGQRVVAVTRHGAQLGQCLAPDIPRHETWMLGHHDLLSRWHIRRLIERERPAIVQTYMSRATDLTRVPRRADSVHIARLGGFYKLKYFRHADHWVGNTKGICDYLVRGGLPPERVHFISNFVDEGREVSADECLTARRSAGMPEDALVVIALGRLTRKKGFDILLDAFARLPASLHDRPLHLLLLGDGDLGDALRQRADQLGIDGRVHWTGWQTDPAPFFALADLFVCPSRHEPLGNVILEAWSHRVPVISTATDGGCELIEPGIDGLLVPPEDATALAGSMRELLADQGLRARLASAGRDTLLRRHGRDAIVRAYDALYHHVTSPGKV
ncbi:MAG: glycosyltransferase [Pseudomonadota bacterium]